MVNVVILGDLIHVVFCLRYVIDLKSNVIWPILWLKLDNWQMDIICFLKNGHHIISRTIWPYFQANLFFSFTQFFTIGYYDVFINKKCSSLNCTISYLITNYMHGQCVFDKKTRPQEYIHLLIGIMFVWDLSNSITYHHQRGNKWNARRCYLRNVFSMTWSFKQ